MKTVTINSYVELISLINDITSIEVPYLSSRELHRYFFRGQADQSWRLIPGALRGDFCNETSEIIDSLNICDFDNNPIQLAVAQHYGKKTRCLDFSCNYKVALYFACNPLDKSYLKDGAIYILECAYHLPTWFTNYAVYYMSINQDSDITNWEFARFISSQPKIINEFKRTGRSLLLDDVNAELKTFLNKGFMVNFENNDFGIERIKKQEGALYYFGSKYYTFVDNKKEYIDYKFLLDAWTDYTFRIELHNIADPMLENREFCTKIIIPQKLKAEIFQKNNIRSIDLGL